MRKIFLALAVLGAATTARAQTSGVWRFGAVATAPTQMLDVKSVSLPDSNTSNVRLGLGFGIEGGRVWRVGPKSSAVVITRVLSAPVNVSTGGSTWSPGRALILEAGGRLERTVGARADVFAGATLSHWSGPDGVAPIAASGAVLLGAEAGVALRPGTGTWHIDLGAAITRFPGDETRDVSTGFVWRWIAGLRRSR